MVDVTTVVVVVLLGGACGAGAGVTVVDVVVLWIRVVSIAAVGAPRGRSETVNRTVPPVYAAAEKTNWSHVSKRTVESYIARARRQIIELTADDAAWHAAKALARYERLFWRASLKNDLGQCRQVEEAIVKLLGLAAPERRELSGPGGGPIAQSVDLSLLSDEELETLDGIRAKLAAER